MATKCFIVLSAASKNLQKTLVQYFQQYFAAEAKILTKTDLSAKNHW